MTQETHPPSDQSFRTTPPSSPLLRVVAGILSLLLWAGVAGQLFLGVPTFERRFAEFRMKLPLVTEWVIQNARWAVAAAAITAVLICILFGRRSSWPWLFLFFFLPLVLNVLLAGSVYVAYMELLEGLGGGKK